MYCNNCGKNVNDYSKFCPYCGETLVTNAFQESNNEVVMSRNTDEIKNQLSMIHQIVMEAYEYFQTAEDWERKTTFSLFIYLAVAGIGTLFALYGTDSVIVKIIYFAMTVTLVYLLHMLFSKFHRRAAEATAEGTCILENNAGTLALLPKEYLMPYSTAYILKFYEQGRARDINDALRACDEYLHRVSVEQNQNKTNDKLDNLDRDIWLS